MAVISQTDLMQQTRGTSASVGIAASHYDDKTHRLSLSLFVTFKMKGMNI